MRRKLVFYVPMLALSLGACTPPAPAESSPRAVDEEPTNGELPQPAEGATTSGIRPADGESPDPNSPMQQWETFVTLFNDRSDKLREWVPEQGFLVLDNPGAFVRVRGFSSFDELFDLEGGYDAARLKTVKLDGDVTGTELPPPVDCGVGEGAAPGVFLGQGSTDFIVARVAALEKYELATADEVRSMTGPAHVAAEHADFLVHDTKQDLKFVFGEIDGHIKLLAIDAVFPCSA